MKEDKLWKKKILLVQKVILLESFAFKGFRERCNTSILDYMKKIKKF